MARDFSRTDRVGSQIQRELAELVRGGLDDPHLGMITIQAVRVARDFSHAKVYFTVMGGQRDAAQVTGLLNDAAPFFRHELGSRVRLRTLPELHFVYDHSVERGERLSALIERAVKSDASRNED